MINGIQDNTQFLTLTLLWLSNFWYIQLSTGQLLPQLMKNLYRKDALNGILAPVLYNN